MNFNALYPEIISKITAEGHLVKAQKSLSVGSERDFLELLNFNFTISEPVNRLLNPSYGVFSFHRALGRFLWLLRGSNRLDEIAYYDPKVTRFSDDGVTIPGSSFGHRIFNSDGINQFRNVIRILTEDRSSRRAVVSVFQPFDNNRRSHDIPCLFGLGFQIRGEQLHTGIIMRSNNAIRLLPYNFFEISLLAEILACELNAAPGPVNYHTLSMHVYTDEKEKFERNLAGLKEGNAVIFGENRLSAGKSQFVYLELLTRLENEIRTSAIDEILIDFEKNHLNYREQLTERWFQYYLVLLDYKFIQSGNGQLRNHIRSYITEPYKLYL